jgi:hypothetical protein
VGDWWAAPTARPATHTALPFSLVEGAGDTRPPSAQPPRAISLITSAAGSFDVYYNEGASAADMARR